MTLPFPHINGIPARCMLCGAPAGIFEKAIDGDGPWCSIYCRTKYVAGLAFYSPAFFFHPAINGFDGLDESWYS